MIKKSFTILLAFLILSAFPLAGEAEEYKDISGHSLEKELLEAIDQKIMGGYGKGRFGPDDAVTRAQFATFLVRSLDLPSVSGDQKFSDVDSTHMLSSSIYRAEAAGIVGGYPGGTFRPEEHITREQMAVMIDRALSREKVPQQRGELNFVDREDIRENYRDAVSSNAYYSIILGNPTSVPGLTRFAPKDDATRAHAAAFIIRMLSVIEEYEVIPEPEPDPDPDPVPTPPIEEPEEVYYQVASISANGDLETSEQEFDTYNLAKQAQTGSQSIVLKNDNIIEMSGGIVRPSNPYSALVYIYPTSNFSSYKTYVTDDVRFGSELNYVSSNDNYAKVEYAGEEGYVNINQVELIPAEQINDKRNYYQVNANGDLNHYLYNSTTRSYSSYRYGQAPSFLNQGNRYYSWDGSEFYRTNGEKVGVSEQYFNSLPVKSNTNYKIEDLNRYLKEKGPINSPLVGLGEAFIKAQEEYGINALYLMSKAIHESGWGTSKIAIDKNNLFGLNASDDDPYGNADEFHSLEDNIIYAAKFIRDGYAHHAHPIRFSTASILGNKGVGFNVKYASDMFWGQKIAGHMFRADEYLGKKDIGFYEIGKTTGDQLNVREDAGTSYNALYTYKKAGAYVVLYNEKENPNGEKWFEVSADHKDYRKAYIHKDFIEKIEFTD